LYRLARAARQLASCWLSAYRRLLEGRDLREFAPLRGGAHVR
jgi:hypothetical protein